MGARLYQTPQDCEQEGTQRDKEIGRGEGLLGGNKEKGKSKMKKKATPRKRKGDWGIFGIRREKVGDIKRQQTLQTLKQKRHEEKLEKKAQLIKKQAEYYEAKARRKKAKKAASWLRPSVPTRRIKTRRIKTGRNQGRKLSRKSRIGLI
jgi:hypothetical protein